MAKLVLVLAAICGLTGVAAGAMGDHALKSHLKEMGVADIQPSVERLEIGVRYQMFHATALIGVGVLLLASDRGRIAASIAALCFVIGVVLFSGGLYFMAFTQNDSLVMLVPIGGTTYMIGWGALLIAGLQARPHGMDEE
ncbi:DUF423 domain-containing protein [Blastopirellula retiformator]|uniref:DUF423 domain-containing protein n=1 Tax=Blastopirellula retiformator TaxID=2527970 RepID=A0A5C5V3N9_9BACT|nr:DUF423 domain-containing protein [Blastopirellula retiformator]TWT33186.1 hypothetical protein Enr8_30110 [Blastopirellula retiformator]